MEVNTKFDMCHYGGLNENSACVWISGLQLVEPFGKVYKAFFCWRKYVTGVIFEVSKDLHHFQCLCSLDSLILLFFFRYLCFLSKERLKGVDPDGRRSREELRRIGEKETILYENKIYIQWNCFLEGEWEGLAENILLNDEFWG